MNLDLARKKGLRARIPGAASEVVSADESEAGDAGDVPNPAVRSEGAGQILESRPKPDDPVMLERRVAEIRDRFRRGFYDQDSRRGQIARRIIQSGDL